MMNYMKFVTIGTFIRIHRIRIIIMVEIPVNCSRKN